MLGDGKLEPGSNHLAGWKESKQAAIKPMDADRLAKIGGFVGGSGPANDYARKTADTSVAILAHLKEEAKLRDQSKSFILNFGGDALPA